MKAIEPDEILYEIRILGRVAKVTALDSRSLVEVSVVCPAHIPQSQMRSQAFNRLRAVLLKRS